MNMAWRRPLLGLGVAIVTVVVFAIVDAAGLGTAAAVAVAAVVAGVAAALAARPVLPASSLAPSAIVPAAAPAATVAGGLDEAGVSALRHDLRGILSPALLTADRLLAGTDDPAVRRAAEVVITTVERANARLSDHAVRGAPPAIQPAP